MDEYEKVYVLRKIREAYDILEEVEELLENMEVINDSDD